MQFTSEFTAPLYKAVVTTRHSPTSQKNGQPDGHLHHAGFKLSEIKSEVTNCKVMIIDDEDLIIRVVRRFLSSSGYSNFVTLSDSRLAIETARREKPDVVLLDINMPFMTGLDLLKAKNEIEELQFIPFLVLSANAETQTRQQALTLGAFDFLSKPVESSELVLRVQNALMNKKYNDCLTGYANHLEELVRRRTEMLEKSYEDIIQCLARAAEFRDNETGEHVIRVGKYASIIADQLGFDAGYCRQLELAAQLHDVGKIGIPDSILLNTGKLTTEEFEVMKAHCNIGSRIISPIAEKESKQVQDHASIGALIMEGLDSPILQLAVKIAKTHHEKWDGTGYPYGLCGEMIPVEGRIVCVADVFDALCSERPYKPRFTLKRCLEIMISERGTRFDPAILDAFFSRLVDIEKIRRQYRGGISLAD